MTSLTKQRRPRPEIWRDIGYGDGFNNRFHPPKFGNKDCTEAYAEGFALGTEAAIKSQPVEHARMK